MTLLVLSLGWKPPIGLLLVILIIGFCLLSLIRAFGLIPSRYVSVGRRALIIGCVGGLAVVWLMYRPPPTVHRVAVFPFQPSAAASSSDGLGFGIAHTAVDLLRLALPPDARVTPMDAIDRSMEGQSDINRTFALKAGPRLGVRYAVFGAYDRADSVVILHARFLDVQDSTEVKEEIRVAQGRLADAPVQLIQALIRHFPVFAGPDSTLHPAALVPSSPALEQYGFGQAAYRTGTFEGYWAASEAYRRALETDSTCALAHYGMAQVHKAWQRRGFKYQDQNAVMRLKAIERAKIAVILNPRLNEAYRLIADIYQERKQWDDMSATLKRAIAADPQEPLNYVMLAEVLPERFQDTGFRNQAELCEQAVHLNPESLLMWVALVNGYIQAGKLQDARFFAEEALALAPQDVDLLEATGIAYNYAQEPFQAIEVYKQAIALEPRRQSLYYGLATAYSMIANHDAAIKTYEQGMVNMPDNGDLCYNLGVLYQRIGKWEQSIPWFEKAVQIDNHVDAHFYLARWYEKQGNRQMAIEEWKQRIELGDPSEEWTRDAIRRLNILSPSALPAVGVSR